MITPTHVVLAQKVRLIHRRDDNACLVRFEDGGSGYISRNELVAIEHVEQDHREVNIVSLSNSINTI